MAAIKLADRFRRTELAGLSTGDDPLKEITKHVGAVLFHDLHEFATLSLLPSLYRRTTAKYRCANNHPGDDHPPFAGRPTTSSKP